MVDLIARLRSLGPADPVRIILPEVNDERVVAASLVLRRTGLVEPLLVTSDVIRERTQELASACRMVLEQAGQRLDVDVATALRDPLLCSALLVRLGEADGCVAGAASTSAATIRAAIKGIGLAPGVDVVSSFFLMTFPNRQHGMTGTYVFADCAVLIKPNAQQLATVGLAAADAMRRFVGLPPRVAFLSFTTKAGERALANGSHVMEATAIARKRARDEGIDVVIDGELQLDAAVVPEIARRKAPGSPLAGSANVLVFPDLAAGNIGYKLAERFGGATAIGPILQGLARPMNDLSRGCSVEDVIDVSLVTALQCRFTTSEANHFWSTSVRTCGGWEES